MLGYLFFIGGGLLLGSLIFVVISSPALRQLLQQKFTAEKPQSVFSTKAINLLVLGCDEDLQMGGGKILKNRARSDMMLVLRLDFEHSQIGGVSIPRDTLVKVKGYRRQRINAYHTLGGDELSQEAVETLLGVDIDRVVSLDYSAFQELVNSVGGVTLNVDKQMDYDDNVGNLHIHLRPGEQTLDGYQAMGFVRFRHSDSDIVRQKRQHQFAIALKKQVMTHPFALGAVAQSAVKMANGAMNDREVASLVNFAQSVPPQNVKLGTIPVYDAPGYTLRVDTKKLDAALKQFLVTDDQPERGYKDE